MKGHAWLTAPSVLWACFSHLTLPGEVWWSHNLELQLYKGCCEQRGPEDIERGDGHHVSCHLLDRKASEIRGSDI